jgi:hypothetical protein
MKRWTNGPAHRPGDVVPQTGIYQVHHNSHRLMHEATLIEESRFPRCRKCNSAVRFALAQAVDVKLALPFRSTELLEEWSGLAPSSETSLDRAGRF